MSHYIYVLKEPDTLKVRYVGETNNELSRLRNHIHAYYGTNKCNWVRSLLEQGKKPVLEIVEEIDEKLKRERERYWINFYKEQGCDLLNMKRGGFRIGGGRKLKTGEPTKAMRVPISIIPIVEEMISRMQKSKRTSE